MVQVDRRTVFLKYTGTSLAILATLSQTQAKAAGANEKISFAGMQSVELAYVCDPDNDHANNAAKEVEKISDKASKVVTDLRQLLDDKSVDDGRDARSLARSDCDSRLRVWQTCVRRETMPGTTL